MRQGDFTTAWRISDAVLARRKAIDADCSRAPRHEQFIWRGQSCAGQRVLVRCYHGLGDTLQFARFLAPLRRVAREVIAWVQPALLELMRRVAGVDRAMPLHDGRPEADYDVDLEIMELAHVLRATPESLGSHVPYVGLDLLAGRSDRASRTSSRPRVGISWRGGDWNSGRSLPLVQLQRLAALPGIEPCSLQFGGAREFPALPDLSCESVTELARRMTTLDLVISVDTMVAHLAGAMGLPVWTLLPASCDWRWMRGREDSPWYPTMRLHRQRNDGDWQELIDRVIAELGRNRPPGS